MLSIGRIFILLLLLSLPKLTSLRFSYAVLLFIIILKVYFLYRLWYGNDSFSSHKFHLMVNTANILAHPNEKYRVGQKKLHP